MSAPVMLTELNAALLAESFPASLRTDAMRAAERVSKAIADVQWTERFELNVGEEVVAIPARLRFEVWNRGIDGPTDVIRLMTRCLETRSNDGYQRQRANMDLLANPQPWSAPFIVDLIGSYVIEILDDIYREMSPDGLAILAGSIADNPRRWERTKKRVTSYWDVYYRMRFSRPEYVGFKLIEALEAAGE